MSGVREQVGRLGAIYWTRGRTWTKKATRRWLRRQVKKDPENAPIRRYYKGWWL